MVKRDNIHYSTRKIDGYNLPFNFVISERELGKSTTIILDKIYKPFKEREETTIVIRRNVNHISEDYVEDFANIINKFTDDNVVFQYSKNSLKDGIATIKIDGKPFIRFIGLSKTIASIKSMMFPNLQAIVFDEFICNGKFGEKYLKEEATKFLEVYNTFRRESTRLKCWFLGNPYSLYNPYFVYFGVNTALLKRGSIITDNKQYVVECAEMCQELRDKILRENPLYQFDNSYTRYAFEGQNINDENILINDKRPDNYFLHSLFRVEGKYIAVYRNNDYTKIETPYFYAEFTDIERVSKKRDVYCFDLEELVDRTSLLSIDDKWKFEKLKNAMRKRLIEFNSIECYYLFEEIFYNI